MTRRPPLPLWLMTPHGELQGEARLVERHRMSFELAAPFRPGDAADFRLRLRSPGEPEEEAVEVQGTLRVVRIIDAHHGAPSLFSAEILSVLREHQAPLEAWLGRQRGPRPRRFEAVSGSEEPEVEVSDPDTTNAYNALDLPDQTRTRTASSEPYGFSSDRQPAHEDLRLAGREAIRAALRRGLEARRRPGRTGGRSRRWLDHTRQRAADQARQWMGEDRTASVLPASVATRPEPDFEIVVNAVPVCVTVRWHSPDAFRRDWERHLRGGGLFVPSTQPIPSAHVVELRLELPSGAAIRCPAQVVAPMPTGAGLSLRLTREQRERLEAEGC